MTSQREQVSSQHLTLLCVGYDREARDRIAASLQKQTPYDVTAFTAQSVDSATVVLSDENIDCIVSEYHLDQELGTELLSQIEDVPVVLFVEEGSEAIASEVFSLGVDEYVPRDTDSETYRELADTVAETVTEDRRNDHGVMLDDVPVNSLPIMLFTIDPVGIITHSRGQGLSAIGLEPGEVVGQSLYDLYGHLQDAVEAYETALTGERSFATVEVNERILETTFAPIRDGDTVSGVIGLTIDVTKQAAAKREAQQLYTAIEATKDGVALLDEGGEYTYVNMAHAEIYGFADPDTMIGESWEILYDDDELERFRTEIMPELQREGEWRGEAVGTRTDGTKFPQECTLTKLDSGGLVCGVRDITEIKEREHAMQSLTDAAPQLMSAGGSTEIARIAVETARDALDLPLTGIWLHDAGRNALVPATTTDRAAETIDEQPIFRPGEGLAWAAFERNEPRVVRDVAADPDVYNPDTAIQSEMVLPLDEHGVLICGSLRDRQFTDYDREFGTILVAMTTSALTRADRETALRQRERELERKNDRLEEFANVVAHDIRNPLTAAKGYLEFEQEQMGKERQYLDEVEHGLDRIAEIVENLLALARAGEQIGDTECIDIDHVAKQAWSTVQTDEARLLFEGEVTVNGDRFRLTQLFENLFRNAIEHGGTDVTVRVGRLDRDRGFYVADDGPGIPEEKRETLLTDRRTRDQDNRRRFGLAIVTDIVDAHDWEISITRSDDGGARFEIVTGNGNWSDTSTRDQTGTQ